MSLLRLHNATLAFGNLPLLDNAEFVLHPDERVSLIGRNGTGKSTLLDVIAGAQQLDDGTRWTADGIRVSLLPQDVPEDLQGSIFDVVVAGLGGSASLLAQYHALTAQTATEQSLNAISEVQSAIEQQGLWNLSQRVETTLSRLGLSGDVRFNTLSGGLRRRVLLARALVTQPDILLLDEPTNHLDIAAIEALEQLIGDYPGAVLFVSHDRAFTDRLATRIVELDRGTLRSFPGNYASYTARKAALLDAEETANALFDKRLAEEEAWIREGIKARRTRNEGRVRALEAMRRERAERRTLQDSAAFNIQQAQQSGALVAEATAVHFSYSGNPIVRDLNTRIMRGDRIGITGPNGCGKSTLLRLLLGELQPEAGDIRLGTKLKIAYFDQQREQLDLNASVRDNLDHGADFVEVQGKRRHVISYLGDFLFTPARANSPAASLSGGERNRLLLARLFKQPANLLVMDEPTNDLDLETLELLEELLAEFAGTLLLVSHDRAFIDRTVTSLLAYEGDGSFSNFIGGYSDWAARRRSGPAQQTPQHEAAPRRESTRTRRLGYKEKRELEQLPAKIEALEQEIAQLTELTTTSEFYTREAHAIDGTMHKMTLLQTELDTAIERWAELESIDSGNG